MMIRSVGYALTWEYWRRGMLWFVPTLLALASGGVLLMTRLSAGFRWTNVGAHLGPALIPFVLLMPLILALASWAALRRHYTLPVRATTLVAWSLANGALAAAGTYCGTAVVLNTALHADWPFVIPALCSATAYLAWQALFWFLGPSGGLVALLAVAGCASLAALGRLSTARPAMFDPVELPNDWQQVPGIGIAVWLAVVGFAYLLAVNGVARERRGDAWSLAWLGRGWLAAAEAVSRRAASRRTGVRFRSAASAQFWFEWRTKGRWVPLTLAGMVGALWVCLGLLDLAPYEVPIVLDAYTILFVLASPLVGVYLGSRTNGFDLKPFTATRPLPDAGLSSAVLGSAATAIASAAAILLVGNVAARAIWIPDCGKVLGFSRHELWEAPLYVLYLWTAVGLGASLALCRQWFACWGGLSFGGLLLAFVFGVDRLSADVGEALCALVGAVCFASTIAAFIAVGRRRLVSFRVVCACLAGYLVLLAYLYTAFPGERLFLFDHAVQITFGIAPLAPFATAPLAVAWNRHR
jgi:hypothetical protein